MRLARIIFKSYVVDLDNEDMVDRAMTCTYEDIMNAVKYNELGNMLSTIEEPSAEPADIPEFLKDEEDDHYCPNCGTAWAIHNPDGSCVED